MGGGRRGVGGGVGNVWRWGIWWIMGGGGEALVVVVVVVWGICGDGDVVVDVWRYDGE